MRDKPSANVVAALFIKEGKMLVGKRPEGKARAGLWEFVGGKTEKGETDQAALIRECKEELSLFGKTIFGENSIVIPFLTKDNKVFGFQTRSTVDKKFFIVLNSNFEGHKIWNLDLVDKSKTIYAFESIFDAVSSGLDNIIALLGIHNYKNLDKNLDVVYCLDNQKVDQTSLEISKEIAKKNLRLFVWTTDKVKDFNELLVKVKDRNKIANYIKNNIYNGLDAYVRL